MTEKVNAKLLIMLALTVIAAAGGAWRLMSSSDTSTETGFDQPNELPAIVADEPEEVDLLIERSLATNRNPFDRIDDGAELDPGDSPQTGPQDTTPPAADDVSSVATSEPSFPDPSLIDQEDDAVVPDRGDPRDDTSFEG